MPLANVPDPFGARIRRRRRDVRASQELLAWVARVSRNTVSNLERGQGEPEDRTETDIAFALGLKREKPDPWLSHTKSEFSESFDEAMKAADVAEEASAPSVIPAPAVRRIYEIIESLRNENRSDARKLADTYMDFVTERSRGHRQRTVRSPDMRWFISALLKQIDPEVEDPLIPMLQDYGWSPEDAGGAEEFAAAVEGFPITTTDEATDLRRAFKVVTQRLEQALDQLRQSAAQNAGDAKIFSRLPLRVQAALEAGEVVDSDIIKAPNLEGVSIVTMIVRDNPEKPVSHDERKGLLDVLYIWHQSVLATAFAYDVFKEQGNWLPPEMMEAQVLEALSTIGKGRPVGRDDNEPGVPVRPRSRDDSGGKE